MKSFSIRCRGTVIAGLLLAVVGGFGLSMAWAEADIAAAAAPNPDSLAAAALQGLELLPLHVELIQLYENRLREEGDAWIQTAQGQRVWAVLQRLHIEAKSLTTVDPENPEGDHVLNYTDIHGKILRFTSVVPGDVESYPAARADAGMFAARFIMDNAARDGLFLYDLPTPEHEAFESGISAAKKGDFAGAMGFFKKAMETAPYAVDLYYNMGLAESMMKGRELRAISWFGAYLAGKPDAVNAPALQARMAALETKSEDMIRKLLLLAEETAQEFTSAYNHDNSLYRTSLRWAEFGDAAALARIAGLIADPDQKSYTLHALVTLQLAHGDIPAAESTVEGVQDLFTKCKAQVEIAEAKLKAGDPDGARKLLGWTLENIKLVSDDYYRSLVLTSIAEVQIKLGELERAKETLAESKRNIALYSLCYSVLDAQNLIAEAETHMGDTAAAEETYAASQKTLEALNDKSLYGNIARSRARTGNIAAALEAEAKIEDFRGGQQIFARQAIFEAQIKAGDIAGAQETADKMGDSYRKDAQLLIQGTKATRGLDSMDWIINLKDEDSLANETFLDVTGYMKRLWIADDPTHDCEVVLHRAMTYLEGHKTVSQMVKNLAEALDH